MLETIAIGGRSVSLPGFFFSVSSVKANHRPSEYVRVLLSMHERQILVSAHDLDCTDASERVQLAAALHEACSRGCNVLLDSGNYESFWHKDETWSARRYGDILAQTTAPVAFVFDELEPPVVTQQAVERIVDAVLRDQGTTKVTTICPIVHAGTTDALTACVAGVAERLQPLLLAVPERELGEGLLARAEAVRRLRAALDQASPTTVLHLLGTGNPIALLVYALAGAQSFDGLEWCHTCVDPDSSHLHHFQHRDIVRTLAPQVTEGLPYSTGTLAHNILFIGEWMDRIRTNIRAGTAPELLRSILPASRCEHVLAALEAP